jgi:hypothetical protein
MIKFHVDPSFWNRDKETTTHFPIRAWRWEVPRVQRELAELVDAHFAPSQLQCTLTVDHEFIIFSTVYLKATGKWRDVDELGRLLEDMRV